ncbi:MAG: BREX system P-loop protein BrxC, partial [Clostridiales bacterium]|nr:BREX system P-loop protein BrxC [Clostridiales bacterium]
VKEIPSNIENLATLMVNHIDDDKIDRKKKIEESLKRLLKETLVQKNGNEYIFLTNEEQDVNNEIKNIPIDIGEIILKVGEEIFTGIYSENRYRYNVRYHFDFNKIIDTRYLSSQRHDIGLQIITPYYDAGEELSEQELKMMSARENNLIVRLPADTTFLDEMEEILKIRTYLRQKGGANSTSVIKEIKIRKSGEVTKREERVKTLLIEAIKNAEIYANLQKLDINSKNPVERINEGFKFLIDGIYNKLNYIETFVESNKDLNYILIDNRQITLTEREVPNKLALDEIDGFIERNTQRNIPMTVKTILHQYDKAPYGWRSLDVIGLLLHLLKAQEIRLQLGNESLSISDKDLINQLTKRDYQDRIIVKKRERIPTRYINNVRGLAKDIFDVSALSSDEDGLMEQFKRLCERELNKRDIDTKDYGIYFLLEEYKKNKYYPGKDVLEKGQELFESILKIKDGKEFYERVYELEGDLLDYEEDVYDVKRFFKNQRDQFDRASRKLEIYENNKTYVVDAETIKVIEEIRRIVKSDKPYSEIHRLPSLVKDFEDRFLILLEKECEPIRKVIESDRKKVLDELALYEFKDELESKFQARFDDLLDRIDRANNFYEAIAMKVESDRIKIRFFDEIEKEKERRKPQTREDVASLVNEDGVKVIPEFIKKKKVKNISINNMLHGAKVIETEEDIEDFLQEIREILKGELGRDTKIKLI